MAVVEGVVVCREFLRYARDARLRVYAGAAQVALGGVQLVLHRLRVHHRQPVLVAAAVHGVQPEQRARLQHVRRRPERVAVRQELAHGAVERPAGVYPLGAVTPAPRVRVVLAEGPLRVSAQLVPLRAGVHRHDVHGAAVQAEGQLVRGLVRVVVVPLHKGHRLGALVHVEHQAERLGVAREERRGRAAAPQGVRQRQRGPVLPLLQGEQRERHPQVLPPRVGRAEPRAAEHQAPLAAVAGVGQRLQHRLHPHGRALLPRAEVAHLPLAVLVLEGGDHHAARSAVGLVRGAPLRHAVGEVVCLRRYQRLVRVEVALRDAVVAGREGQHVRPAGHRAAVAPERRHRGGRHRHRGVLRLYVAPVAVIVYEVREGASLPLGVVAQVVEQGAQPAVERHLVAHRLLAPPLDGVQLGVAARQHLPALAVEGERGAFERVERRAGINPRLLAHGPVKARKMAEDGGVGRRPRKGELVRVGIADHRGVVQLLAGVVEQYGAAVVHIRPLPAYV